MQHRLPLATQQDTAAQPGGAAAAAAAVAGPVGAAVAAQIWIASFLGCQQRTLPLDLAASPLDLGWAGGRGRGSQVPLLQAGSGVWVHQGLREVLPGRPAQGWGRGRRAEVASWGCRQGRGPVGHLQRAQAAVLWSEEAEAQGLHTSRGRARGQEARRQHMEVAAVALAAAQLRSLRQSW